MFAITAPRGSREGDPWFVVTMSVLGLVGFVVQPHVMTATGSGKTETEARVGMVYGNFIKTGADDRLGVYRPDRSGRVSGGHRRARRWRSGSTPRQRDPFRPGHSACSSVTAGAA